MNGFKKVVLLLKVIVCLLAQLRFNIIGVYHFLGEEGCKKRICRENCLKRGAWTIYRGLRKKERVGRFCGGGGVELIPRCTLGLSSGTCRNLR